MLKIAQNKEVQNNFINININYKFVIVLFTI